eukprot:scaffold32950_cov66-Attheya_sp.AAC.5
MEVPKKGSQNKVSFKDPGRVIKIQRPRKVSTGTVALLAQMVYTKLVSGCKNRLNVLEWRTDRHSSVQCGGGRHARAEWGRRGCHMSRWGYKCRRHVRI